ncbi:hypothetical protein R5R35_011686 [Gryllus longicercus]|uniref:Uncharacterized protein n=1 Tax=Gryllus longicercus TaxID=2509291 RepID=A0AAN9Z1G9_9ORTH
MGADVLTMDLTGLFDEEEDAFAEYRLALTTQFVSEEAAVASSSSSSPSSTAVCVSQATAPRLIQDPACPVFLYTPPKETDIWAAIAQRAESSQITKHWDDFPKGVAFEITSAKKIVSERFGSENYAVVLNDKFCTFLPTRFTSFINEMGVDEFLKSRPHTIYFGKNPTNKAFVLLIYPFEQLKQRKT